MHLAQLNFGLQMCSPGSSELFRLDSLPLAGDFDQVHLKQLAGAFCWKAHYFCDHGWPGHCWPSVFQLVALLDSQEVLTCGVPSFSFEEHSYLKEWLILDYWKQEADQQLEQKDCQTWCATSESVDLSLTQSLHSKHQRRWQSCHCVTNSHLLQN